jgi:hypothetical protein
MNSASTPKEALNCTQNRLTAKNAIKFFGEIKVFVHVGYY